VFDGDDEMVVLPADPSFSINDMVTS